MPDDAMHLYRQFLAGKPGPCIFTGKDDCHAFVTEDEIDATTGSRHDTRHFVWLDRKPGEIGPKCVGYVSDDHIDVLLAGHRIAYSYSDRDGPAGENHDGVKATFLLGVFRMSRVLALPLDAEKRVPSDAIDTLPLVLRARFERLAVLSRVAVGADLNDLEDEAERCAAWVVDRDARQSRADEVTRQMLE
jgi:hypothetical protein